MKNTVKATAQVMVYDSNSETGYSIAEKNFTVSNPMTGDDLQKIGRWMFNRDYVQNVVTIVIGNDSRQIEFTR